jgi:serine/threonine-protein kinase HipA
MSRACLICLEDAERGDYHPRCLKALFGRPELPAISVEVAKLHTFALAMVGKTTLSGMQRKVSLNLTTEKNTFQLAVGPGRYILKPQSQAFPALPENEHVTMRLAALVGVETPPTGLVRLGDGTLAYIALRFDRLASGGKLRQEDFCQLAGKPPKEKYDGSAEMCVRIVRRYATEPLVEMVKLFRLMVLAWWSGNGDMHLKNYSLLGGEDGVHRLSPAYDQLCTRLVIADDDLALPVGGKKSNLSRPTWLEFATYAGLPSRTAERVLGEFLAAEEDAGRLISRSLLSAEMKKEYRELIAERTRTLAP